MENMINSGDEQGKQTSNYHHKSQFSKDFQNENTTFSRDAYETVVLPTMFPGQQKRAITSQERRRFFNGFSNDKSETSSSVTYQNTNLGHANSSTIAYTFMQQQLNQYRLYGTSNYAFMENGNIAAQNAMRSQIMQPHRTRNTRNFDQSNATNSISNTQSIHSPSPKRSSKRHHHGHQHYDLLEPEALQKRHKFPTNFCRVLRELPPPVPPVLLRAMPASNGGKSATGSALQRHRDPANRLKITIRVLSSASSAIDGGGSSSPEASFLVVDNRKKQVTLMEQAQQRQTSSSQQSASTQMVPKIFGFDAVFSPDDSQTEICSTALTELVQTVCNDGDGCLLMFGSSDQGKVQTSVGSDTNAQTLGILPCAISWLYRLISEIRQRTGARFSIRVSAVEVTGAQEDLRDLLYDFGGSITGADSSTVGEICLREDPIFGTQLHNVNELRAPTADKAAFYLDAALAKRKSGTEEERRNSHFFYTLHIYQYRVNEKQATGESSSETIGVAGGRTRLHLIDLGAGEKNTRPGRASLTLPALGNVLLTLLQGQKHLPFKESKVTQILKSCIGSASCKTVSVIACASSDPERRMETVNVVQIAGRLYRIRRTKRGNGKFGFGAGNSSGGESSADDRSGRRRFPRSASDPDCTTSSSEQSCDTVIYLGAGGTKSRTGSAVSGACTCVAISDQDIHPPIDQQHISSGMVTGSPAKCGISSKTYDIGKRSQAGTRQGPISAAFIKQTAYISPSTMSKVTRTNEQWIDGPKASKQPKFEEDLLTKENAIENIKSTCAMDPFKREMIRQWVQEQERATSTEVWIDRQPNRDTLPVGNSAGPGARQRQIWSNVGQNGQSMIPTESQDNQASESMNTSSSARSSSSYSDTETQDIGLQCCEDEIDYECGRYNIPLSLLNENELTIVDVDCYSHQHNNNTVNQEYAVNASWAEPEMRMLEDIAEVEEEENTISTISDGRPSLSTKASSLRLPVLMTATSGAPPYRNEALAPKADNDDGVMSSLLTAASSSSLHSRGTAAEFNEDEHPLRILSKEQIIGSRSDTFSLDNDDATDAFSLSTSDLFTFLGGKHAITGNMPTRNKLSTDEDSSSLTDEDLERAMQASLTSIRSHEILEKLKSEGKLRKMDNGQRNSKNNDEIKFGDEYTSNISRPEPEGFNEKEAEIALEKLSKYGEETKSSQLTSFGDKLTKPTVPPLAKPVANLVTSQLISGLTTVSNKKEEIPGKKLVQKQLQSFIQSKETKQRHQTFTPSTISVLTAEEYEKKSTDLSTISPKPQSSLPRPTKLPSPRSQEKSNNQPPPPTMIKMPSVKQKEASKPPSKVEKEYRNGETEKTKSISSNSAKQLQNNAAKSAKVALSPVQIPALSSPSIQSTTLVATEKSKSKSTSSGSVLKSPIMSFLKSPSKFRKTPPNASPKITINTSTSVPIPTNTNICSTTAQSTPSKRASSGYDSGHDSGIVTVDSPDLLLASPYSKLTKPRASQRSSSGHGSDNSSAVSSDTGAGAGNGKIGKSIKLTPSLTKKAISDGETTIKSISLKMAGCASTSSGYESTAGRVQNGAFATTSPDSASDLDNWKTSAAHDQLKSPPSVKLHRRRWLEGFGFDVSKSRSAPQSPSGTFMSPLSSRPNHRMLQSQYAAESTQGGQMTCKGVDAKQRSATVEQLKIRQHELKRELKQAKERLGVPASKWSYDLHVSECMDITNPNMVEALEQETRILEKRVAACKSHVLMMTVFDATPVTNVSFESSKRCS